MMTIRSIDTMKISRDRNNVTNAQKIAHCNALATLIPDLTHITLDCYTNNFSYHSVSYIQEWVDAIRGTGKKIWWRPAFNVIKAGAEATLEEYTASIMEGPEDHPEWFADGDLFEMQPETHPFIGELNGTAQDIADWNAWIRSNITELESMFSLQGHDVDCGIVSVTDGYAKGNYFESETITAMGNRICYDSYPLDLTSVNPNRNVAGMLGDIRTIRTNHSGVQIIMSEFGHNNLTSVSDTAQRTQLRLAFNALAELDYVIGMNYWVAYNSAEGGGHTQILKTDSITEPRPAMSILSEFYTKGRCSARMNVI